MIDAQDSCDPCIRYAEEHHYCPHCNQLLSCCHAPPIHVGDGLGWGSEVLFICLNDDCPLFVRGWKQVEEQYGHAASYRYMLLPGAEKGEPMMVGSKAAFTGMVIDPEALKAQNKRYADELEALKKLDTCVQEKNLEPVLFFILDEKACLSGRKRACELLIELNDVSCIDPIRNHRFKHHEIEQKANMAISEILRVNYQKECPYCAELIKIQATVCKHCKKELE